jgi:hypothetical protein
LGRGRFDRLRFVGRPFGRRRLQFCMRLHQIKEGDSLRPFRLARLRFLCRFVPLLRFFFFRFVFFDFFAHHFNGDAAVAN